MPSDKHTVEDTLLHSEVVVKGHKTCTDYNGCEELLLA